MTLGGLFSLTTRFPLPPEDLGSTARSVHLLPLVAGAMALVPYAVGLAGLSFLPPEVAPIAILVATYAVSGLLHLDGLSDFADGAMAKGSVEAKIAAMKDVRVGIAGTFAVVVVLLALFASLRVVLVRTTGAGPGPLLLPGLVLLASLLAAEVAAKSAMLTAMFVGRPMASGMGSYFVGKVSSSRYLLSLLLGVALVFPVAGRLTLALAAGPVLGLAVALSAARNFGGVNGDALGACNELGRAAALMACAVMPWTPW